MALKAARVVLSSLVFIVLTHTTLAQEGLKRGPVQLQVDNLASPLGIDDPNPNFSWKLQDDGRDARQTAYRVLVASSPEVLKSGKADVWDSGKISTWQSLNVRYAGPSLAPSKRYFWQVMLWGRDETAYPHSEVSSWETGLLSQTAWNASWIGFETSEESAVRNAKAEWITGSEASKAESIRDGVQQIGYRGSVQLDKPVQSATLYATCRDTVSAWVNGSTGLSANPLPPYKQMPWKKYVRADVGSSLSVGQNTLALECVHYEVNPNGMAESTPPPLSATLYVAFKDGTDAVYGSGPSWKSSIDLAHGWQEKSYNDSAWSSAVAVGGPKSGEGEVLGHPWIPDSVKRLRTEFDVKKSLRSARIYSTAMGSYELFLNGKRVSDDILAPGWTDYRERVVYQTYDVTDQIKSGHNAVGALLAPGWYSTPLEWFQQPNNYGDTPPALRVQLRLEFADGSVEWLGTNDQWKASTSYIKSSEIYDGESQDARLAEPGWNTSGFAGTGWSSAALIHPHEVPIEAQTFQPIRTEFTVKAQTIAQPKSGVYVFDFGQNLTGVERIHLHGAPGTVVRLRFAEILNDDGTLYIDNLRTAKVTDYFTLSGKDEEFTPQFTFHGFRYAEVTGVDHAPSKEDMTALVIHTAAPLNANLKTGSEMVNKLWKNILWGQRSNFVGVPTDCPQRDERLGWMADAQVFWRTATYDMDIASFSRKYSTDMRGTQAGTPIYGIYAPGTIQSASGSGAGWSDAGVVIPWTSWLQTGDTKIIEENWAAMQAYLGAIEEANPDKLWKKLSGTPFGDWLSPEGKTDQVLVATAYWAYDVSLMSQMAHATGRKEDEQKYAKLYDDIRQAFAKRFVKEDGFIEGADNSASPFGQINNPNAKSKGGDTQTGYVLALHMNLLPDSLRAAAIKRLVKKIEDNDGLLGTGFLGTPYLLEELAKGGEAAFAYKLLLNTRYPSWGYLVEHGATTMWERWNGDQMKGDPSMNSYNHYAYGAVADWIYRYSAGIDAMPADSGFHTVLLHPVFDSRIGAITFDYDSSYGPIHSDWAVKGDTASWHLTIPANTSGLLQVSPEEASHYRFEGIPLNESKAAHQQTIDHVAGYRLASGTYSFEVRLN